MSVAIVPAMRKTRWPLYLTIAVAAVASIATSPPPSWWESRVFQGPAVQLDQTRATDAATFTVQISKEYADPWDVYNPSVEVVGVVSYELASDAPQDLRISLVTPDQTIVSEQIHALQGAGLRHFSLRMWEPFACASDASVCEQTLAVEFDAGGITGGAIDIEWYLTATTSGDGADKPDDLVFDVALADGEAISYIPDLRTVVEPPVDEIGDGRWLTAAYGHTWLGVGNGAARQTRQFSLVGEGSFSSSALSIGVAVSSNQVDPADFRLAVLPEESDVPVAEQIVTMSGEGGTLFELRIPEPLDCPEGTCKRNYVIVLETTDAISSSAHVNIDIHATLDGEGEQPPADVAVSLQTEDPYAM